MGRGGARPNAGRKKKPLAEKLLDGNPSKRPIKILEFDEPLPTAALPEPPDYLSITAKHTEGVPTASEIYTKLSLWLKDTGCLHLINPVLLEDFAVNRSAWLECEAANARHGRIVKSGDGSSAKRSPYVDIALFYYEAYLKAWSLIWAIVSQNSEKSYTGFGYGVDPMEKLLSGGRDN